MYVNAYMPFHTIEIRGYVFKKQRLPLTVDKEIVDRAKMPEVR